MDVIDSASVSELEAIVDDTCHEGTTVNTDEWNGCNRVGERHHRVHQTVDHSGPKSTWAIDAAGDGVLGVHCTTLEGLWTGVRNFLRPFRGVSTWYLAQDVAIFQWAHNLKSVTDEYLRIILGIRPNTSLAS